MVLVRSSRYDFVGVRLVFFILFFEIYSHSIFTHTNTLFPLVSAGGFALSCSTILAVTWPSSEIDGIYGKII